jgi:hypothetical protein
MRAGTANPEATRRCLAASMDGARSSTALPPSIVTAEDRPERTVCNCWCATSVDRWIVARPGRTSGSPPPPGPCPRRTREHLPRGGRSGPQSIDDPWREALCSQGVDGLVDDLPDVDAGKYFRSDAIGERGLHRRVFDDRAHGGHEPLRVGDLVVRPDGEHRQRGPAPTRGRAGPPSRPKPTAPSDARTVGGRAACSAANSARNRSSSCRSSARSSWEATAAPDPSTCSDMRPPCTRSVHFGPHPGPAPPQQRRT